MKNYELSTQILVGKPERNRSLGRARRRWKDNLRKEIRKIVSFHHRVQNGSRTHPTSYPMGTKVSLPEDKAAEA
jgi:hypothetical protein